MSIPDDDHSEHEERWATMSRARNGQLLPTGTDDSATTQQFDKLIVLLKKLFQLDQPDLDFGFYRIMHARSAEVTKFLEQDLAPQIRGALSQYESAERAATEKELADALKSTQALGVNPDDSTTVKTLRAKLAHAVDVQAVESEVYDHLYGFFRRYYSEGDFISQRVYKPGVYAIPYEGEEVKLHWATADQYYVKTSEHLRDYAFQLRPGDNDPMRVRFQLVDAAEGEHGNVKEATASKRVFLLRDREYMAEEEGEHGKELVVYFNYRPATLADWPKDQRAQQRKPPDQKELLRIAEECLLKPRGSRLVQWINALAAPHTATGGQSDHSQLYVHLNRYTARNTFDYFIHKDLGGFLRRELDFYIKNEVVHMDDVKHQATASLQGYIAKIGIIRDVGAKIVNFLAQLENYQKKIWLKKKFVVETSYCIRFGIIPKQFHDDIFANDAQREEWARLLSIDFDAHDVDALASVAPPTLLVDSRHFQPSFTARLLDAIGDISEQIDGVLFHCDNFQALSLMTARYRENLDCIYIDPPYNSKTTTIAYKNAYRHSSWLSLMANRLTLSRRLATLSGSHIVAIDENEQEHLGLLLRTLLPDHAKICVSIVHNKKGIQGAYFSYSHDYAFFCIPPGLRATNGISIAETEWQFDNLRKWGRESERHTARNCFYPVLVKSGDIVGFGDVCADDFHPANSNVVDGDCTLVYPVDRQGIERKWRYARESVEKIRSLLRVKVIKRSGEIQIEKARSEKTVKTVWDDPKYIAGDHGTRWLTDLGLKIDEDLYPKSIHTVMDSIRAVSNSNAEILDYFAGSGTTGHAVIQLNREDNGRRKFVLVEMGDYFDTVLLPRIKKIVFTPEWRDGAMRRLPTSEEIQRSPRIVKAVRLESYEDTLNNLVGLQRNSEQQAALDLFQRNEGAEDNGDQHLLKYVLDVETRESPSLLNVAAFVDPTAYRLRIKRPGSDESREVNVDLLETFNWLIGLTVHRITAPRAYEADTERDEEGRLRLAGTLKEQADGRWWFRMVTGTLPDGRSVLVIWRKRPGGESPDGMERDNLILDEWCKLQIQKRGGGGGGFLGF